MKVLVTGFECSGSKWVTDLLAQHPQVEKSSHASFPDGGWPNTTWPSFAESDAIVWCLRYEPMRLQSCERMGYDAGRANCFRPPALYVMATSVIQAAETEKKPLFFLSYESLLSPLGRLVLGRLLTDMGLDSNQYPWAAFCPTDGNAKYLINRK